MNKRMWAIFCEADMDLLWSNEHGWTSGDDYDLFTDYEKDEYSLPIGGVWRERWIG